MASKSFLTRLSEADALGSSIEQQADGVGADLEELLAPVLREGETMPDMALAVRLLGRYLGLRRERMKASNAEARELRFNRARQRRFRRAAADLRQVVVDFRRLTDGPFGAGTVERLFGISGRTPRDSDALELVAERILERLRDPETVYPPTVGGIKAFPREWIPELEPRLQRLKDARKDAYGEIREGHAALGDKHRDQGAYDQYFKPLGWVVKGLYTITGRLELFKKLRLGASGSTAGKKGSGAEPVADGDETSAS